MSGSLKVLLVGGPRYDPLYSRLAEFEEREGLRVEKVIAPRTPTSTSRSKTSSHQEPPPTT